MKSLICRGWSNPVISTGRKIGHFGNIPEANLLPWYGKTKPNTYLDTYPLTFVSGICAEKGH